MTIITVVILLTACAGGGKYPPSRSVQADISLKKFRDLFLEGRFCAAEDAFRTALRGYASLDSPCDIAEAYLERYLMFSYIGMPAQKYLEKAIQYASLESDCVTEMQRIKRYGAHTENAEAEDPLSRSIALRKKALKDKNPLYLKDALRIDRAHGWSALLWRDLRLLVQLTRGSERTIYQKRLKDLEKALDLWCLKGDDPHSEKPMNSH